MPETDFCGKGKQNSQKSQATILFECILKGPKGFHFYVVESVTFSHKPPKHALRVSKICEEKENKILGL